MTPDAGTETWEKRPQDGNTGWFDLIVKHAGGLRLVAADLTEPDADTILRLRDEAREAQRLRTANQTKQAEWEALFAESIEQGRETQRLRAALETIRDYCAGMGGDFTHPGRIARAALEASSGTVLQQGDVKA